MKTMLITQFVKLLLGMLSPEMMKRGVDALLDVAEDAVAKSETKVDDKIVTPLIESIRNTFDIPDDD